MSADEPQTAAATAASATVCGFRPSTTAWLLRGAALLASLPPLVAGVRAAASGWFPAGDDSYALIRATDVFTAHPPLLGYWSSASLYTGYEVNHPGPLLFDLLAVPVKLLGPGAGVAVGTGLINTLVALAIIWVARRLGGPALALLTCAFLASLMFTIGSALLFDPWCSYLPMLPFVLLLMCTWATLSGEEWGLPLAAVAGSLVLETHLSYVILVPCLIGLALVGRLVGDGVDRHRDRVGWQTSRRRPLALSVGAAVVVALVLWCQPLYQQATGHPGNATNLVRSASVPAPATPTVHATLLVLGGTVAQPPFWLPPSFSSPTFKPNSTGRPLWLDIGSLLVLLGVGLLLGRDAWRRRDRVVGGALVTVAVGFVAAVFTVLNMPLRPTLTPTYLRWLWPFSMFVWLALVTAALRSVRARRTGPTSWVRGAAVAACATALVLGLVSFRTVDNGSASPSWAIASGKALSALTVTAVRGKGPVLVRPSPTQAAGAVAPVVMAELQSHGIPFVVSDEPLVRQVGGRRRFTGRNANVALLVTSAAFASSPPAGYRVVGLTQGLTPTQRAEFARVKQRLVQRVRKLHGIPLGTALGVIPESAQANFRAWAAQTRTDPGLAVSKRWLETMYADATFTGQPVIDVEALGKTDLDLYAHLQDLDDHGTAVLLGPVPPAG